MKAAKQAFQEWKAAGRPSQREDVTLNTMKLAKKQLRKTQRQMAARQRTELYRDLMCAEEHDQKKFFQLIRKQRDGPSSTCTALEFTNLDPDIPDVNKWANYFQQLATPKDLPIFDDEHKRSLNFRRLLTRCIIDLNEPSARPTPPNVMDIAAHVTSLKNGKAADIFGITSEHIKYASPVLLSVLTTLADRMFTSGKVPDDMRIGLVTPVPKKGKPLRLPDSYRRITVSSIIGKVIEKEIVKRTKMVLDKTHSPLQFGFTEKVSCNNAAALLTEAIAEGKAHSTTYVTFMDASKCFDVVDHDAIMSHLYSDGIDGQLWSLYDSLYSNITSVVKWQGQTSEPLKEGQGIRQGGLSSTELFKNRANPLLRRLEHHPDALRIGSIRIGAIMVADDLALLASSPMGMQTLIKEAELDASRERYSFSETKTKCITIKSKKSHKEDDLKVCLNNVVLENTEEETHIGICRQTNTSNSSTISARIQTARRTSYALMGAGLHGLNDLSPKVSKSIWATYVFPKTVTRA
jgi:retron-type reverse transcriptase